MIDHLVFIVADLAAARQRLLRLGLPTEVGGQHPRRGTHNALLRVGPRSYLELLAVDPASAVPPPRWMGIDRGSLPRMSRWAVNAGKKLDEYLRHGPFGEVQRGSRHLPDGQWLRWRLTDPGSERATDVLPFLIDWEESPHPARQLPDRGVELLELRLFHPRPESVNATLERLGVNERAVRGRLPRIEALLHGRLGTVTL